MSDTVITLVSRSMIFAGVSYLLGYLAVRPLRTKVLRRRIFSLTRIMVDEDLLRRWVPVLAELMHEVKRATMWERLTIDYLLGQSALYAQMSAQGGPPFTYDQLEIDLLAIRQFIARKHVQTPHDRTSEPTAAAIANTSVGAR